MGDREGHLRVAREEIEALWSKASGTSSVFRTEAWGMPLGTPDFLNQVVRLSIPFDTSPDGIMQHLMEIETSHGRLRMTGKSNYESRTLDLDLLAIEGLSWQSESVQLPHPKLHLRKFVLLPMQEIDPEFRIHATSPTVAELLSICDDPSSVHPFISTTFPHA